jgi:hypothetical protein
MFWHKKVVRPQESLIAFLAEQKRLPPDPEKTLSEAIRSAPSSGTTSKARNPARTMTSGTGNDGSF